MKTSYIDYRWRDCGPCITRCKGWFKTRSPPGLDGWMKWVITATNLIRKVPVSWEMWWDVTIHGDSAIYDTIVRMARTGTCVIKWWMARVTSAARVVIPGGHALYRNPAWRNWPKPWWRISRKGYGGFPAEFWRQPERADRAPPRFPNCWWMAAVVLPWYGHQHDAA